MEKLIFSSGDFFTDEMKRGEICCASFINRIVCEIVLMFHEAIS